MKRRKKAECVYAFVHAHIHTRVRALARVKKSIVASHFHEKSGDRDDVFADDVATSQPTAARALSPEY